MIRTATIHRIAGLTTGGLILAISLVSSATKAGTICNNGLPLSTLANSGPNGYTCESGKLEYTFMNDIVELNLPNQNGYLNFNNMPLSQQVIFSNLAFQGLAAFTYKVKSLTTGTVYNITSIDQTYTQDMPTPSPLENQISATLPGNNIDVAALLETDESSGPPNPKLTSLTHSFTLEAVPGPVPVVGTTLALGFSRKLRGRIQQAKRLVDPTKSA